MGFGEDSPGLWGDRSERAPFQSSAECAHRSDTAGRVLVSRRIEDRGWYLVSQVEGEHDTSEGPTVTIYTALPRLM